MQVIVQIIHSFKSPDTADFYFDNCPDFKENKDNRKLLEEYQEDVMKYNKHATEHYK